MTFVLCVKSEIFFLYILCCVEHCTISSMFMNREMFFLSYLYLFNIYITYYNMSLER